MAKKNKAKQTTKDNEPERKNLPNVELFIDENGRISRTVDLDTINSFLNETVPDKKFTNDEELKN